MTGEVAGFSPEHEVHSSTRSRIRCILMCVTIISLLGLAVVVAFVVTYATDPPGLIVHPDNVLIIQEIFGEESAKQSYVDIMNSYVDTFDYINTQNLPQCSSETPRENNVDCIFQLDRIMEDVCQKSNNWGYDNVEPCFFLTFNEPKNWVPEPYTSPDELPLEMPKSLRTHIKEAFTSNENTEMLWVSCTGEHRADDEFMGPAVLLPWQGFPKYYFPVRANTNHHAIPVLSLSLPAAQSHYLIRIKCHFWAKNLEPPHIAARIELLM